MSHQSSLFKRGQWSAKIRTAQRGSSLLIKSPFMWSQTGPSNETPQSKLHVALLATVLFKVEPKRAQMAPRWSADYQAVNILGKYDNLVEKSMHRVCPGTNKQKKNTLPQQMLESPLSSLNKQTNWSDLLIIYRMESQGATAFVADTDSICRRQEGFVFHHWLSLRVK